MFLVKTVWCFPIEALSLKLILVRRRPTELKVETKSSYTRVPADQDSSAHAFPNVRVVHYLLEDLCDNLLARPGDNEGSCLFFNVTHTRVQANRVAPVSDASSTTSKGKASSFLEFIWRTIEIDAAKVNLSSCSPAS
ncbi:hypothetical protein TB2_020451 [Malus domestica]